MHLQSKEAQCKVVIVANLDSDEIVSASAETVSTSAVDHPEKAGNRQTGSLNDFFCLLGAYFMLRLPWLFMLPMVESPDEFAHHWVIQFLKINWRFPTAAEVVAGGPSAIYGSLPQLGYLPHILCSFAFPNEMLALSERFGSMVMGAVMLFAAFKVGNILFPNNRLCALAVPAAIAAHPQIVFIHSYANNDSTSSALASLLIWLTLETANKGLQFKRTCIMGAITGYLAIAKYSGLAVIPVAGLVFIASAFVHGCSIVSFLGSILCAGTIAAALSLWWFIQNNQQYPGDPMGTHTMYSAWAKTFNRAEHYYLPASHIIKDHRWWRMTYYSFWGLFGYMNKYLPKPFYFIWLGMTLGAVLGWCKGLKETIVDVKNGTAWKEFFKKKETKVFIMLWGCLALTASVNIVAMIWASMYNLGGPQGRYLITSEIPLMALSIGGLKLLGGNKFGTKAVISFLVYNLLVCVGSWIYLFQLYGGWHLNPLK